MECLQARDGSQMPGSGVGEVVEDGEDADLEVDDGGLGLASWAHGASDAADDSPRTPHAPETRVIGFGHGALPEDHHQQPAERFESSLTFNCECASDDDEKSEPPRFAGV